MIRPTITFGVLLGLASAAHAQAGRVDFERYELANGLTVILAEDHSVPVVSVDVWYHVGSRNERPGRSGFAHLFEHMMFQGSENVAKGEHMKLVERAGGAMNGTTNEDRTNYFETVPANRMNLALWLEADRMRSLAVTRENLDNQQEVVKEERRQNFDNQPYFSKLIDAIGVLYDSTACYAYSHSVIGSMEDLDAASIDDVREFFDLYYSPNNATLAVVGDFDPAEARSLISEYFGSIPRGETPPAVECGYEFNVGARTYRWVDDLATLPAAGVMYRIPPYQNGDVRALELLGSILGQGESSRLNVALVRGEQLALQVQATTNEGFIGPRGGPGFFAAFGVVNQGVTADALAEGMLRVMERVATEGVSDDELAKAKNQLRAQSVLNRQVTLFLAERLQHYEHFGTSVDDINRELDRYADITVDDLRRVAREYLGRANSMTVLIDTPPTEGGPTP